MWKNQKLFCFTTLISIHFKLCIEIRVYINDQGEHRAYADIYTLDVLYNDDVIAL